MRRAIRAEYVERCEDCLYYRKHNGIAQFYCEYVSKLCEEAKSIANYKSTPTPWTDAGVATVSAV